MLCFSTLNFTLLPTMGWKNAMLLDLPTPTKNQSEMTRHLLSNSGEKMHFCSECEESFNQAGNLNSHMATHIREKNVTCVQCNRQFGQARNLKRHLLIHSEVKNTAVRALV